MDNETRTRLLACQKCRRLNNQFKRLRISHPDYWNKPVLPHGATDARVLIVGLAPGMHGANRTGKPFIGDASGDLLNATLDRLSASQLVRVTNAVKCLPIKNLPSGAEVKQCARFLDKEIELHRGEPSAVVFALGGVAHRAVISVLGLRQVDYGFAHGAVHEMPGLTVVDSYHCSRYNTQTGRLTPTMFHDALKHAIDIAYDA